MASKEWMERVTHVGMPGWDRCNGYKPTEGIRAVQRTKVLSEYYDNRITQEKWQEDVFKAARMARNFIFHADHTTPKEVVELLSHLYEERYGSALI